MPIIKREITFSTSFIGFHKWENAPEPVSYLKDLHRHKFLINVKLQVSHGDRQREFHDEQSKLNALIPFISAKLKSDPRMSCEHIGEFIYKELYADSNIPSGTIEVSEDGECSGIISFSLRG